MREKRGVAAFLCLLVFVCSIQFCIGMEPVSLGGEYVQAVISENALALTCEAYVLMDGKTGEILSQNNATEELAPASITKIMTVLLIMEELKAKRLSYETMIPVSEHAASMGGSQVFLEPGEELSVEDMLKCICIASANDASVAMAEYIAGSEPAFVERMNAKAAELGMENTQFVNCCGLDADGHYTSAKDVALMSRALTQGYPEVYTFTTTWMDSITHKTARGESEFGLSNTNKLLKSYSGITGLKTGSTGVAKYCLSATASRDGMDLIAVIMAAPDTKTRFREATQLLDFGFANYHIYTDEAAAGQSFSCPITGAIADEIKGTVEQPFSYLLSKEQGGENITFELRPAEALQAPVEVGTQIGILVYFLDGEEIGSVPILAGEQVEKAGYLDYFSILLKSYF